MPIPWLIPAIAGVVSIVSQAISSRSSKKQAERTNAANLELSKYGYAQDQLALDKQNLYNSPSAQLKRYSDAGLNPNMIYGSGSQSAGNQPSSAKFDTPRADLRFNPFSIPEVLSQYQNFQMGQAQIDNVKAQTQNTNARTQTEAMTTFLRDIQGKRGKVDLDQKEYIAPYQNLIVGNQARASEARLQQEWQRVRNMSSQEQMMLLQRSQLEKNLTSTDLQNEKTASETLFNKYRNEWAKEGVTSSDNYMLRIIARMMIQSGISPSNYVPNFKK